MHEHNTLRASWRPRVVVAITNHIDCGHALGRRSSMSQGKRDKHRAAHTDRRRLAFVARTTVPCGRRHARCRLLAVRTCGVWSPPARRGDRRSRVACRVGVRTSGAAACFGIGRSTVNGKGGRWRMHRKVVAGRLRGEGAWDARSTPS